MRKELIVRIVTSIAIPEDEIAAAEIFEILIESNILSESSIAAAAATRESFLEGRKTELKSSSKINVEINTKFGIGRQKVLELNQLLKHFGSELTQDSREFLRAMITLRPHNSIEHVKKVLMEPELFEEYSFNDLEEGSCLFLRLIPKAGVRKKDLKAITHQLKTLFRANLIVQDFEN